MLMRECPAQRRAGLSPTSTGSCHHSPVDTPDLKALAIDFARRVRTLPWLTDALLINGDLPTGAAGPSPRTRTIENHIILIGPAGGDPSHMKPIARSTRSDSAWIRVSPWRSKLMDKEKYYDAVSSQPLRVNGKEINFMAVHLARRATARDTVRFAYAHSPEMDHRGARAKLANDEWVHHALATWLNGAPTQDEQGS